MSMTIPTTGHYVLVNATVPAAAMGDAQSGLTVRCDITIADGLIAAIEPAGQGPERARIDVDGGIILPAFVDMHTHLDKGHIWPRKENPDGTWAAALQATKADRASNWTAGDVERRMDFALRCAFAHGTAAIRTHLDMAPPHDQIAWDVFEKVREKWAGRVELQAAGLMGPDLILDARQFRTISERIKAAGGILGGSSAVHPDNRTIMLRLIEMAGELDLGLDLHIDESADPAADALECLADAVLATGFSGHVTAGHCCSLAMQPDSVAARVIDKVAAAGIAVVSLPMCNMYLQDRSNEGDVRTPRWRGVTLIRELRAAGVRVAIASDNTRDPFHAYGDLDALEVLREGARILQFDHPQADAWTWTRAVGADAATIAVFDYTATIMAGAPADFVIFRARNWTELLSRPQSDRVVVRSGRAIGTALPDYRELDDLTTA